MTKKTIPARTPAAPAKKTPATTARPARKTQAVVAAPPPAKALAAPAPAAKPDKSPQKAPEKSPKKPAKARPELVRDSFTMPHGDFALIAALKATAMGAQRHARKSELLRAGLRALAALDAKALVASLDRLQPVKVGRPKKGH